MDDAGILASWGRWDVQPEWNATLQWLDHQIIKSSTSACLAPFESAHCNCTLQLQLQLHCTALHCTALHAALLSALHLGCANADADAWAPFACWSVLPSACANTGLRGSDLADLEDLEKEGANQVTRVPGKAGADESACRSVFCIRSQGHGTMSSSHPTHARHASSFHQNGHSLDPSPLSTCHHFIRRNVTTSG